SKYTFRQPIGDMNVVMTAESQRLRSFYHSWYRPDLMALAVVTPHDPEMLALEIKKRFTQNPDRPTVDADGQWPDRVEYRIPIYRDTMIAVNTADHLSSAKFSYFYIMPAHRQIDSEDAFARALHQRFFNSLSAERFTKVVEGGAPFRKGTTSI